MCTPLAHNVTGSSPPGSAPETPSQNPGDSGLLGAILLTSGSAIQATGAAQGSPGFGTQSTQCCLVHK